MHKSILSLAYPPVTLHLLLGTMAVALTSYAHALRQVQTGWDITIGLSWTAILVSANMEVW